MHIDVGAMERGGEDSLGTQARVMEASLAMMRLSSKEMDGNSPSFFHPV